MKSEIAKYTITVLLDLNDYSSNTLKSAVGLAKMIGGTIDVFYAKKPTDIVNRENQLSAIRSINQEHAKIDKKMRNLIMPLSKEYEVGINYSFEFGNVKNEIKAYIKKNKPSVIVLGKRKSKTFNFIGNNITEFVLNTHNSPIVIAADKNPILPGEEISLGMLNCTEPYLNLDFAEDLMKHTQNPVKSFKILKNSATVQEVPKPTDSKTVEYIFNHNDNTIKNLSKYILKHNINIVSIDSMQKGFNKHKNLMMPDISRVLSNLNVALLITGK